jgi:hypothetical protein
MAAWLVDPGLQSQHVYAMIFCVDCQVRQIVRIIKSLPIAQKQAGWSRLQMAYLGVSDDEVRRAMQAVQD